MFVVKKKIHGREYYYLNENKRIEGKVVTKTVAYLGKDKKEAEKKAKNIIGSLQIEKKFLEEKIEKPKHVKISIEELANFCKAKGFVFRSSDIYGGFAGFWDFGPLGVELFNNIKRDWWNFFVYEKENVVGINASVISHPRTWKASGHISGFKDLAVVCKKCKKATKIEASEFGKISCENCQGEFEKIGEFNLLFKTNVGALDAEEAYLRGETAQAMFMDFKLINQTSRMHLPFGIAQIGRCFRNEIAPRDFLFRSREFHIAEIEFFIRPDKDKCSFLTKKHLNLKLKLLDAQTQKSRKEDFIETSIGKMIKEKRIGEWHAYWLAEQIFWFQSLGLTELKVREHTKDELAHYSSATFDIDYEYSFGSKEVAGNANRGQYDLIQQQEESKQPLEIFDEDSKKKVLPRVIEPTFGIERVFLALLTKAYSKNSKGENILRLPPKLAPIKTAVFPIVKRQDLEKVSENIVKDLKKEWNVVYDRSGSIGRRYARNDEIGTPYCITVDEDSVKKKEVTVRWRDTGEQIRIKISNLKESLRRALDGENILDLGKKVNTRKKKFFK